jgi:tetratricopeptide (TPR) repeat protein
MNSELARFKEQLYLVTLDIKDKYLERAVAKIQEMLQMYPHRAELHYELGKLEYNNWNNEEAEKHFKKALEVDANYFPTYTQYALILIKEQRYREAEDLLNRSMRLRNREDSDIYFYLGLMHQHQGRIDSAIQAYTQSLHYSINDAQIDSALKFIRVCKELRGWE